MPRRSMVASVGFLVSAAWLAVVDNSTTPVTSRAGSNHGASIVKVEPLE